MRRIPPTATPSRTSALPTSGTGHRLHNLPRLSAHTETVIVAAALFWALAVNTPFLRALLDGRDLASAGTLSLAAGLVAALWALHALLLGALAGRRTVKPLVAVLTVVAAGASWFSGRYGAVLDPAMMRNVLHTDVPEARELIGWPLLLHLTLFAAVPLAVLSRVDLRPRTGWKATLAARLALVLVAAAVLVVAVMSVYSPLSSVLRVQKDVRYRITPANVVWSLGSAAAGELRGAAQPRQPLGLDARLGPNLAGRPKPQVLVLVVGETARAANWGLAGYARDTTPRLRALQVVDFGSVQACGTHTEASVPCLFAPVGRRDYDEARIRGQESLLHLLARAGVSVHWRDNQSGCKGVCDGLPGDRPSATTSPGLCEGDRCLDEALVSDLDARLQWLAGGGGSAGTQVWVLHMLGNHGPAYFRRYPPGFAAFTPECRDEDLSRCAPQAIANAYDNAVRYTDHVLARAIEQLSARADTVDSALLYVSDHGESLGELGLYLHGLPYALAPDVQKQVPMVFWASSGFEAGAGLPSGCLDRTLRTRARAGGVSHDHVFHTVLGLLDVSTAVHEPAMDMVAPCRAQTLAQR